eukprot:2437068-Amphidinium_carterae.1
MPEIRCYALVEGNTLSCRLAVTVRGAACKHCGCEGQTMWRCESCKSNTCVTCAKDTRAFLDARLQQSVLQPTFLLLLFVCFLFSVWPLLSTPHTC